MAERAPGGYPLHLMPAGTLYASDEVPDEWADEEVLATGSCIFEHPIMLADDPTQSPPLRFDMTATGIWTFNLDGSLYHRTSWDNVTRFVMDQADRDRVAWRLRGTFVDAEFTSLRVEPTPETRSALLDFVRSSDMRIRLDLPAAESN